MQYFNARKDFDMDNIDFSKNDELFKSYLDAAKQTWEDDPEAFKAVISQLKKALNLKPDDPEANLFITTMRYYDTDMTLSKLFDIVSKIFKDNSEDDIHNEGFSEQVDTLTCIAKLQIEDMCDDINKQRLYHDNLMQITASMPVATKILEMCVEFYEKAFEKAYLTYKGNYLDALKGLSQGYSTMFKKLKCKTCSSCNATVWKYEGDLNTALDNVNEKILKLEPNYEAPKVSAKQRELSSNKTEVKPKGIKEKIKNSAKLMLYGIPFFIIGIVLIAVAGSSVGIISAGAALITSSIIFELALLMRIVGLNGKKDAYCPRCHKKYNEKDIDAVKSIGRSTTENSVDETLFVVMTCSECKEHNHFTKKVTVAHVDENGWMSRYEPKEELLKYFDRA